MHTLTKIFLAASLTLLSGLLAACGQSGPAGMPQAGEPEVTVVTIAPKTATITTELSGRTSAFQVSEVRPQVGGIVKQRLFREGSDVKAGEALYLIDPASYQAAFESARAALAKAQANAEPARLKAERYAGLLKVRGVSQQDNDEAQAAHKQTEAEVAAAKAALDNARINLAYTRVAAPISGRIGKSSVTPGALVTASQAQALATIQQTDQIYVDVTQSSAEVLRLKREMESGRIKKTPGGGAKVKLFFEDGTAYAQEGVLQFADISVDQSTGSVNLRAVFPNKGGMLLPGLYVRAVLEEGVEDNAILVPQAAVMRDNKGVPMVLVVKPDNTVEPRPIAAGRAMGDQWLVNQGLAAGDRVIVEGLQKARPGAKVKPVEAGAAPQPGADNATANANATAPAPAKPEAKPEAKTEAKPEAAPAAKAPAAAAAPAPAPEAKPQAKPEAKPEATPEPAKPEAQTGAKTAPYKGAAYSPPKDQPWPGSTLTETRPEAKAELAREAQPARQ